MSALLFALGVGFAAVVVLVLLRYAWEDHEDELREETIRVRARRERENAAPREPQGGEGVSR